MSDEHPRSFESVESLTIAVRVADTSYRLYLNVSICLRQLNLEV